MIVSGHVAPAELCWPDAILPALRDIKNAAALGSEEPFVPVGGQRIDMAFRDIQRKGAQALNGINKEKAIVSAADLTNCLKRSAISAQILHEADGQQPGV